MDSSQLTKGAVLQDGKYRIESVLGQGGFGITYLARQELLDRKVAIKEFFMRDFCSREGNTSSVTFGTASNRDMMERYLNKFLKEARTIAALAHPNIIQIHDIFKENNTAYYVMDYIEGESLSQLVKRRGILPGSEAIEYIRAVAEALKYIHGRNINHLDVKPGNIMVRHADNRTFLLDFGLSKQYDVEGNQTSSTPVGISHGYAPIEQYKPGGVKEFSPQTDIYALGATLYCLVTGTVPPSATEMFDTELTYPETLSASVRNTIQQSMKVQKKERPQNVDAFLTLLDGGAQERVGMSSGKVEDEATVIAQAETPVSEPASSKTERIGKEQPVAENTGTTGGNPEKKQKGGWLRIAKITGACAVLALAVWVVYAMFFNPSPEELFAKADEAYKKGDYVTAVDLYRLAAEQGYADAQNGLGSMYFLGQGVPQNDAEAAKWYRKAAEQGHTLALSNLASCYNLGRGVRQDYGEAVKWYRKAAEQGDLFAQLQLGNMYSLGQNVPQDDAEAVKWYRMAAEQGNKAAEEALRRLADKKSEKEETGLEVNNIGHEERATENTNAAPSRQPEKEEDELTKLKRAAENGDTEAQIDLGVKYTNGQGVSKDFSEALKWFRKASEQGHAVAQYNLGVMYENGQGVPKNYSEAVKWYRKAAEQGYARAQNSLGFMYYCGQGVPQDYLEAMNWYRKSAEQGYVYAQNSLGFMYEKGHGVPKNYSEAMKWYRKAAEQGYANAQYNLGLIYKNGQGVPQDYAEAAKWYRKAAEQGLAEAQNNLGSMYYSGQGVPQDYAEALTQIGH